VILVLVCDNSEVVLLACYTLNTFIKFYVYLVLDKVIDVLEYLHISVSAKVPYLSVKENDFTVITDKDEYHCSNAVVAAGRSGSKWISEICDNFGIKRRSNRVDIGVRVEIPAAVFEHITSKVYESKIVYRRNCL
jgi:uncharacterized protein